MDVFRTRKSKINSTKRKNLYVIIYFKGGGAENWFKNIGDKREKIRAFTTTCDLLFKLLIEMSSKITNQVRNMG